MNEPDTYQLLQKAIGDVRRLQWEANRQAAQIAVLLPGNLRCVDTTTLAALKRELQDFNIHTGRWKKK